MFLERLKRYVFGDHDKANESSGTAERGPAPRDDTSRREEKDDGDHAPRGWPSMTPGGPGAPPGAGWRAFLWFAVLLFLAMMFVNPGAQQQRVEAIAYSDFKQAVRQGRVAEVTIEGQDVRGIYAGYASQSRPGSGSEASSEGTAGGEVADVGQSGSTAAARFTTTIPSVDDPDLMPLLEEHGVKINAVSPGGPWWARILLGTLPWLLLIGLLIYFSYRMQRRMMGDGGAAGGGPFSFGRSPAKREEETGIGFDDVAGVENAKSDLAEIVDYLKEPERYRSIGAKIPKGVLLLGSPGTGKTLLARAVAGEAGVPFFSISASEFIEMFVGVGAKRVRGTFQDAKKEAPSIVFIDEIDSVGRSRGAGLGGGHDEREQTLNQILNEMDGFEPHENVVVLAATNRPDVLDAALMRPGRFDRKVALNLPDRKARKRIVEVHTRDVALADDVDLDVIAKRTVGFAGADLENLVNEAALLAGRERRDKVNMESFENARDKIVLGAPNESILGEEQRRVVAYHESGHALMAWLLPQADPLDKVTVIPRGRALGATEQTPEEDQYNVKRTYLLDRIGVMLGGRGAEQVIFGDVTNGAEADLSQVTQLVQRMVCRWGMSERLGAVSFKRGEEHVFLGREIAESRDFSEQTARDIDEEVHRIVSEQEERVQQLLKENRHRLERLAEALLERETVHADQVARLFEEADEKKARDGGDQSSAERREAAYA